MQAIDLPESRALLVALPPTAELVGRPEVAGAWASPSAVAGYTVGGLAGHLARAVERVLVTLDAEVPPGEPVGPERWFLDNRIAVPAEVEEGWNKLLRDDGEALAADGPDAVARTLAGDAGRIAARLAEEPADRNVVVLRTNAPATLASYLATRVIEVLVHADDLATSVGVAPPDPDPAAAGVAIASLVGMARSRSGDLAVLRALTRRERLPDPYDALRVL